MTIKPPFPYGHNPAIEKDINVNMKDKKITVKGFTEHDIRELREMLLKEVKRQNG